MADSTLWWVLAGLAVAAELFSGTFYLMMLALGMAGAALSAHMGLSLPYQMVVAAAIGGGAVLVWHLYRRSRPLSPPAQANKNVYLDIGEVVQVDAWNADGTTSVRYRGAQWSAKLRSPGLMSTGAHKVAELQGSQLILEKI